MNKEMECKVCKKIYVFGNQPITGKDTLISSKERYWTCDKCCHTNGPIIVDKG